MHAEQPGALSASLGISRRTVLRRGALVAGALVWATPVVHSLSSPAFATGTQLGDIGYVAVLLEADGRSYRAKWAPTPSGELTEQTGARFRCPGSTDPLYPEGSRVTEGKPTGLDATALADGSVAVRLPSGCTLQRFVVSRGACAAGPGAPNQPGAGRRGPEMVVFTPPRSGQRLCA